jgi:rhodanese-related sulfurtransferase
MRFKQATRESCVILCVAALLGFSYTFFTGKGFFATIQPSNAMSNTVTGSAPSPINLAEAKILFDTGGGLFVDARHAFDYRRGHIRSAINIPVSDFDLHNQNVSSLPKNRVIVVYCDESECNSSIELAAKLYEDGYGGVRIFFGGWQEWTANKFPIDSGQ